MAKSVSVTPASPIEISGGGSSSRIVPMPWLSAIVAFVGAERLTKKVSSGSSSVSPVTAIAMIPWVDPG